MVLRPAAGSAVALLLAGTIAGPLAPGAHATDPPAVDARPDTFRLLEDQVLWVDAPGVLANDRSRDRLRARVVDRPESGRLRMWRTGFMRYTPPRDASGTTTFTYLAQGRGGGGDIATARLVVVPVNDAPRFSLGPDPVVAEGAGPQVAAGFVSGIGAGAPDEAGQRLDLAVTRVSDPGLFSEVPILGADGTLRFTPAPGTSGTSLVVVTLTDDGGTAHGGDDRTSRAFVVRVTGADDPSVLTPDVVTVAENQHATGNVLTNDSDPDSDLAVATYSVGSRSWPAGEPAGLAGIGALDLAADGDFTFVPARGWHGRVPTVTYTTTTGADSTLDITVVSVNEAPVAVDDAVTTDEDNPYVGDVLANDTDGDGDALAATIAGAPTHGTVVLAPGGTFTYTPDADWQGTDAFTYAVADGQGGSDTATVTVTVTSVNDAPSATGGTATSSGGLAANGTVVASDPEGDSLTYSIAAGPIGGTVVLNGSTGSYTYTPTAAFAHAGGGTDTFAVTVSDGNGGTSIATVIVIVEPVNTVPTLDVSTAAPAPDRSVVFTVTTSDADGDTVTVAASAAFGTFTDNGDGTWTYRPNPSFSGQEAITVTALDAYGGMTIWTLAMTVPPL